ncbi:MAG: hypothetical protein JSU81_09540 [Candidatus Coatesbacteria bacterium]|nr:MAG: hypothetical protein JSU81_09540 [Candidatus Coatesbacteria bacterium]
MLSRVFLIAVCLSFALLPGCSSCRKEAPPPPTPIEEVLSEAVAQWEVGRWCEYRLTSRGGKESEVFVALTGRERLHGKDYFWLEVVVEREGRKAISKALLPQLESVSFLESGKDLAEESERLIVKVGDTPAVELPLQELQLLHRALETVGQGPDLNEVFGGGDQVEAAEAGAVEYETLAGKKIACEKLVLSKAGEDLGYAYVAEEVPIFGIAFSEHEGGTLELVDYGDSGAETAIKEEPQKLDLLDLAPELGDLPIK